MKSIIKFFFIGMLGLGYWGCSEDEEPGNEPIPNTPNTVVNFALEKESGDPLKVSLTFDKAAGANGSVSVRLSGDAVYGQHFSTTPAPGNGVI